MFSALRWLLHWLLYGLCLFVLIRGVQTVEAAVSWLSPSEGRRWPPVRHFAWIAFFGGGILIIAALTAFARDSWLILLGGSACAWGLRFAEHWVLSRDAQ